MNRIYPPELGKKIRAAWSRKAPQRGSEKRPPLPAEPLLTYLLEIVFHATLLREEGRNLEFKVIAYPREKFDEMEEFSRSKRCAVFEAPREFSVAEVRRLAPAAESMRSMICVEATEVGTWKIWGLLDTGSNWWEFIHHETSGGYPPPPYLTIASANPGELVVSSGGEMLLSLRNGATFSPQSDLLYSGVISDFLESTRAALYKDVIGVMGAKKWDPDGHDNDYPKRFYNFCLARIVNAIRLKRHGGALLLVPNELSANDSRLTDRVALKHPCTYDFIWKLMVRSLELHQKYYSAHFPMWDAKTTISADSYKKLSILEGNREDVGDALSDCVKFIAALTSVDGALVMTKNLRVLGFGAEVIVPSPTLRQVKLVSGPLGGKAVAVSVEGYGTRHRSAFRFCSSYEESVAFIVSQDGGIKIAKRVGADVLMWPDVSMAMFGV